MTQQEGFPDSLSDPGSMQWVIKYTLPSNLVKAPHLPLNLISSLFYIKKVCDCISFMSEVHHSTGNNNSSHLDTFISVMLTVCCLFHTNLLASEYRYYWVLLHLCMLCRRALSNSFSSLSIIVWRRLMIKAHLSSFCSRTALSGIMFCHCKNEISRLYIWCCQLSH